MRFLLPVITACFIFVSTAVTAGAYAADLRGSAAPDFSLKDMYGMEYTLSQYKGKQPVLMFFWTTWCPYCIQKIKFLNNEYVNLEKDNIALLAINAGEPRRLVERLVRGANIMYKVLLDDQSKVSQSYRISGVPTFLLIDKEGVILYKGNSYPQSDIQRVVAQK